jgi:hypothetical protein
MAGKNCTLENDLKPGKGFSACTLRVRESLINLNIFNFL